MPHLSEEIEIKIDLLAQEGNVLLEDEADWSGALAKWEEALALVPNPKTEHPQSTWLYGSIGEAYLANGQPDPATNAYETAYRCPDGHINPYILLQLGKLYADANAEEAATKFLLRAYMIEGEALFEGDAPYLAYLRKRVTL